MSLSETIKQLSWDLPQTVQDEAVREICRTISLAEVHLLLDKSQKTTWHNVTLILEKLGVPFIHQAIPDLLWLLQDLNWPGAQNSLALLSLADRAELLPKLEAALVQANDLQDFIWIAGLKQLVNRLNIKEPDFSDANIFHLLSLAEW